jgi:putative ATP-binding cassette transporter
MRIFRFFVRLSGGMAVLIAVVSIIAGACNTLMLAVLNRALAGTDPMKLLVFAFVGSVVLKLGSSYAADILLIRFAARTLANLRDRLALQITQAPLRRVERLGAGRLISLLTGDIEVVNSTYLSLPYYGSQLAVLGGGAIYLAWLSPPTLLALVLFSTVALIGQTAAFKVSFGWLEKARRLDDVLLGHFRGLTDGLKQLKLNRQRRDLFLKGDLAATSREGLFHHVAAGMRFSAADHLTQLSLYVLLALLIFLLPTLLPVNREALTGYVLTIVFLMGPLRALLGGHSKLVAVRISIVRLEELALEIQDLAQKSDLDEVAPERQSQELAGGELETIELKDVALRYDSEGAFALGPVNGVLRRGETLFVTGGNGSGKTTLVKVLCGLYEPDAGSLAWNGVAVGEGNRDDFRQLFSGVLADHHLFDRPLGSQDAVSRELPRLLEHFRIAHRVSLVEGRFPDLELSRGQRARLAFVLALLEDRPVYVFDEWAAEQDPSFRRRFYEEFVPALKARGKTVIVITHDERFFHLADRLWHVTEGKCEERNPREAHVVVDEPHPSPESFDPVSSEMAG